MDYETLKTALLKEARNAFEIACTMRDNQRLEVYLKNGEAKMSDCMEESEELIYGPDHILCYQVYGHDYLEDEIKTWIDYARVIEQPEDGMPMPEPTDIEKSIRELINEIAQRNGVPPESVVRSRSLQTFRWTFWAVLSSRSLNTGGAQKRKRTARSWHSNRSTKRSACHPSSCNTVTLKLTYFWPLS